MSSKRGRSSSKPAHCTIEGAGWPAVAVEIEHLGASSRPSKKLKSPKDVNRRRKPVPKTIEFEAKGSLKLQNVEQSLPTEKPADLESQEGTIREPLDIFDNWMADFDDAVQAMKPDEVNSGGGASQ
ncbi:hypothetical protein FRC08_010752 [Ceratobasidium sp. 394]|nr:hypothetical protein FRC08_010752 [Ceratobasidium sp. 394]